jgi:phosphoglucomutase
MAVSSTIRPAQANEILESGYGDVKRMAFEQAIMAPNVHHYDYVQHYMDDLAGVIDMHAISFMTVDKDGKIRMGCSSAHYAAMFSMKDKSDIAFGNDPDADRQ